MVVCSLCKNKNICSHCGGRRLCLNCHGRGSTLESHYDSNTNSLDYEEVPCQYCETSGKCSFCFGTGKCPYCEGLREREFIKDFEKNMEHSKLLISKGCYEDALVRLVTAFETYLKEAFFENSHLWFEHIWQQILNSGDYSTWAPKENHPLVKKAIIDYFKELGLRDEYLSYAYIYTGHPEAFIEIKEMFSDKNKKNFRRALNFQDINSSNSNSSITLFKRFFNISIPECSSDWKQFQEIYKLRHEIIHSSLKNPIEKELVEEFETLVNEIIENINSQIIR